MDTELQSASDAKINNFDTSTVKLFSKNLFGNIDGIYKGSASKYFDALKRQSKLIKSEFHQLSLFQRLICFITLYALFPIVAYFSEEPLFAIEMITDSSDDFTNTETAKHESQDNLKKFFYAAKRLPWLYVVPSLPMVVFFSIQHLVAHAFLKNTLSLRIWNHYYRQFAAKFADPRFIRDVALDLRPFLSWLFAVPPAVVLMLAYRTTSAVKEAINPDANETKIKGLNCFRFRQQINKKPTTKEKEFFYSPWFTPVALAPFLFGLPAMFSYFLYWHYGVDKLLGFPSHCKYFAYIFPFIGLYLSSLGWALSTLFFKSYFTLGLSYTSTEYDIEVYNDVIKMLPIKGWFADFLTFRTMHAPAQILWKDVSSVKLSGSPEPIQLHMNSKNALLSAFLKVGESFESVARKMDIHTDYLTISSGSRLIDIRLWELSEKDKVELFKCIREYAPSIYLDAPVQKALIGSSVMREPKYTEIWFSVLQNHAIIPEPGDLQPQTSLKNGAYCIEHKLAAGGQGVVYKATNKDGMAVVLKEFILISGESLEVMIESAKEFENETKIMHQLDHPMIVKTTDMFHENGRVYIALEYIEGESLRQTIKAKGALPTRQVLALGRQMCEILEYLHSWTPPIVHRDFTPENLILQPDGKLKLIDFSVAQEKEKGAASESAGKHAYTPPEQFRGDAVPQSDLYACGATMFFLATGQDPEPITMSTLPDTDDELKRKLGGIIAGATALDIASRCRSAEWLRTEIMSAQNSDAILERQIQ